MLRKTEGGLSHVEQELVIEPPRDRSERQALEVLVVGQVRLEIRGSNQTTSQPQNIIYV